MAWVGKVTYAVCGGFVCSSWIQRHLEIDRQTTKYLLTVTVLLNKGKTVNYIATFFPAQNWNQWLSLSLKVTYNPAKSQNDYISQASDIRIPESPHSLSQVTTVCHKSIYARQHGLLAVVIYTTRFNRDHFGKKLATAVTFVHCPTVFCTTQREIFLKVLLKIFVYSSDDEEYYPGSYLWYIHYFTN